MKIPFILVGCGNFSLQRLEILIDSNKFEPVACVDLNIDTAKSNLLKIDKLSFLADKHTPIDLWPKPGLNATHIMSDL